MKTASIIILYKISISLEIPFHGPATHGAVGCSQESFMLVCWCHQLLSGFLGKGHLPRVSRKSRLPVSDSTKMR